MVSMVAHADLSDNNLGDKWLNVFGSLFSTGREGYYFLTKFNEILVRY